MRISGIASLQSAALARQGANLKYPMSTGAVRAIGLAV